MDFYSYRLRGGEHKQTHTRYYRRELEHLTTLQLRDICYKERIVIGIAKKLNRQALIEEIMRFRGMNENALIRDYDEENLERLQRNIKRFLTARISHDGSIQVPAKMIFFMNLAVTTLDHYLVETDELVQESNVLLTDDDHNIYGILNLKQCNGHYYLTAEDGLIIQRQREVKHYNLLFFNEYESSQLYEVYYGLNKFLPAQLKYYRVIVSDLRIEELVTTSLPLAIDFGSSATSAGAYLERGYVPYLTPIEMKSFGLQSDEINLVQFEQTAFQWEELLPSVLSIQDCAGTDEIIYRFGQDALQYLSSQGYNTPASHFHAMKRWIDHIDKEEELVDESNHVCYRTRLELLSAFLEHVVHKAEQQFKCRFQKVHLSAPIRLQAQFMDVYQRALPNYDLVVDEALDEGLCILYNSIKGLIDRHAYEEGKEYKALIFDCGGSTSDLSSCKFSIENGRIAYNVSMQTTFENGDINFGGNNLTYRIMQYLKIMFYRYYCQGQTETSVQSFLSTDAFHAYRYLDDNSLDLFYEKLNLAYDEAEQYFPTRFGDYRHAPRNQYLAVHSNFYFLWYAAEKLKQRFFEQGDVYRSSFHSLGLKEDEYDLKVTPFEPWSLQLKQGESFQSIYAYPKLIFNVEEIKHLIQADVYCCIRNFLQPFYDEGSLNDYMLIRMVGRSCKIESFKDSIKEFVPGKRIQFSRKLTDGENLKLSCLRGAIAYLNDRRMGLVDALINNELPVTPYEVTAFTHDDRELTLISCLERLTKSAGFVSRNINTKEIEFHLKDTAGNVLYTYQVETDFHTYQPTTYHEVNTTLSDRIRQDDVDSIRNREIKFFVFAYANWWGFYVLPIGRNEDGELFADQRRFFSFENERWETDFFDGFQ